MDNDQVYLKKPTVIKWVLASVCLALAVWMIGVLKDELQLELRQAHPDWWELVKLVLFGGGLIVVLLTITERMATTLEFSASGVRVLLCGKELLRYPREKMGLFCHSYGGSFSKNGFYHSGIILLSPEEITEERRKVYKKKSVYRTEEKYLVLKPDWQRTLRREYLLDISINPFRMRSRKWLFMMDKNTKEILAVLHSLYPEVLVEDYSDFAREKFLQKEKQKPAMPVMRTSPNMEEAAIALVITGFLGVLFLIDGDFPWIGILFGAAFLVQLLFIVLCFSQEIYMDPDGLTMKRGKKTIRYWAASQLKTAVQLDRSDVAGRNKDLCFLVLTTQSREEILKSAKYRRNDWQELLSRLPDYEDRVIVKKMDMKKAITMTYTPGLEALIRQTYPHIDYISYPTVQEGKQPADSF